MSRIISFKHPIWVQAKSDDMNTAPSMVHITGCIVSKATPVNIAGKPNHDIIGLTISSFLDDAIAYDIEVVVPRSNICGEQNLAEAE